MMVPLLFAVLSWGIPSVVSPHDGDAYLGVIERLSGEPVWVRAAFTRERNGEWTPTPPALPARITWRACRDGHALGALQSWRRPFGLESELGTHALPSRPAFAGTAPEDDRFRVITTDRAAARPFVVSTLPDACAIGASVRRAGEEAITRVTRLVLAQRNLHTGKPNRLMDARGWQTGDWTIVDLTLEQEGTWFAVVAFAREDDIRYTVMGARVVDWISADGDGIPDVVLWIDGNNRSGYMLVYGNFERHAELEWPYP
jgi:hypothetical protein